MAATLRANLDPIDTGRAARGTLRLVPGAGLTLRLPAECTREYHPRRILAEGGFGTVWLATQVSLGRPIALKVLDLGVADPEMLDRFQMEARATAAVRSPHVVEVLDVGSARNTAWIVYELLAGPSLRCIIDRLGPLHWRDATGVVMQIASGLATAHAAGILHRDLKPDNVVHDRNGLYKVIDFGIAHWPGHRARHTRDGVMLGTPAYMSPEAIRGEAQGPASDLYALGAIYCELITGRPPFPGSSLHELFDAHLNAAPPQLAGVPAAVADIVTRLLSKEPERRYESADEAHGALSDVLAGDDPDGASESAPAGVFGAIRRTLNRIANTMRGAR